MSSRGVELDLSLSGSQVLSARSTKSNKATATSAGRLASSAGAQERTKLNSNAKKNSTCSGINRHDPVSGTGRHATPQNKNHSQRHDEGRVPASSDRGLSDDFLAFFESQGARPKVKNKSPAVKKNTVGAMRAVFPGSAESTPRTTTSRQASTATSNQTRHSIFRSETPRSVSTVDDFELNLSKYSPLSTARSNGLTSARDSPNAPSPRNNLLEAHANNQLQNQSVNSCNALTSPGVTDGGPGRSHSLAVTSNLKHLNAANNMISRKTSQSQPTKLELRTMQNSYQNPTYNVNKTPVNEIYSSGYQLQSSVSKNQAEDYIKSVNMAASVIQHAFRRYVRQRRALRASEAAMKRLLSQKKEEMSQRLSSDMVIAAEKKKTKPAKKVLHSLAKNQSHLPNKDPIKPDTTSNFSSGKMPMRRSTDVTVDSNGSNADKSSSDQQKMVTAVLVSSPPASQPQVRDSLVSGVESQPEAMLSPKSVSPNQSATRTTLEDLMSTLEQLEEEEHLPAPSEPRTSRTYMSASPDEPVEDSGSQLDKDVEESTKDMASSKLQNILSFLDEVETKDQLDSIYKEREDGDEGDVDEAAAMLVVAPPGLVVPSAEEMEQMEQASAAASEVTNTVLKQRLQLEEKSRTILMLQKALNQQRELTVRHAKETEKELSKRLDVQKNEYEETVQRHLNFIDQLIDDKKSLGDKCESLVTEMKQMEKKYSDKIKNMQDTHDRELAKVKDMITTQEKIRREKWIDEKTKKIKDLTVKGLEPEIQRLINKHKSEIKKLKAVQEAELLAADERAGQRYVSMTEELRDQLAKEKEAACQRERELAAQRYEKQVQAEEEAYQQTRRRLYQEIQDEKERLSEQAIKQKQDMDRLRAQLEETQSTSSNLLRREYEKSREENNRRHEAELQELKERLAIEKEAWEQNYLKKKESWMVAKEREIKESLRQERDKEIDLVICRLEEDGQQAREECERAAENRIKRIREKYEKELEELERSERQAIQKYNSMKAELLEATGESERLKVLLKQKEREVDDIKRLSEKLHSEREHVSDVVRQEFADKIVATGEENKRIKLEMAELKSQHKIELERMKQEVELVNRAKQEEMDAVHSRVKQAIAKKDEVVQQLRQQHQAALKRADHLEGLLEQQRKQLLGSKK